MVAIGSRPTAPEFVDRVAELRELRDLAARGEPALALLYGRRRVGKTYLLDHAFRGGRYFYFLAGDTTAELNKRELLGEIAPLLHDARDGAPELFPSWRHVFRLFADLAKEGPLVVVIDEFQNLLGGPAEDIPSQLMAVWDREVRGLPLLIVLCGSEVSTLQGLADGAGPLYGRWSWAARLRPFTYEHAAEMVPGRPLREKALLYGILGGTPRFLATVRPGEELGPRVAETVLSPRGSVHVQLERIVEQERGIRDPADYRAVLTAIADGHTEVARIAQATGLAERPHVIRRALEVLEGLELVSRERNFGAPPKAPWRYYVSDNALRFWHRFVQPNRSRLETGDAHAVWTAQVAPQLDQYMGKVFEGMCREAYATMSGRLGLQRAIEWSSWEGQDRDRRSIEIDLVAKLDDDRILTGEVKWSSSPVGPSVHTRLLRDLERLAASGHGWAKDALTSERSAGHLYLSAAGFTAEFARLAEDDGRIVLLDLEDLYDSLDSR
ncbi:MAG: hypothetical protein IT345_04035 [Trueperaceae bacterium]|nr:hypothetical protein [Trueperaceae bacterium]